MSQFYSYLWLSTDGTPYYVGKGQGDRAFENHPHRVNLSIMRPADRTRILVFPMASVQDAFESEKALIELFGRELDGTGCLMNTALGGNGGPSSHSDATREKIRTANLRKCQCNHRWAYKNNIARKMKQVWESRRQQ
jgi:hypothetical protein